MISERYKVAISETLHYLNGIKQDDINKIPDKLMNFLRDNKLKGYECNFDYTKPLNELQLMDETRAIIGMICLNYWCETEEQRNNFKKHLNANEMKYQEELNKKYNPNNIFKTRDIKVETAKNSVAIMEYKEPTFTKIKNWFKRIF